MQFVKVALGAAAALVMAGSAHAAVLTFDATNAVSPPRADGSGGSDHSFFFNDATFTFTSGAVFEYDDVSGEATLTGFAADDSDPSGSNGLDVALFFDETDWTASRMPKIEVSSSALSGAGIVPTRDWLAFELIEDIGPRNSVLRVVGSIAIPDSSSSDTVFTDGDEFDVFSKPTDGSHVFQMGNGANGKNLNFGMSGWFGFEVDGEEFCGGSNVCDGNMDFSLRSGPPTVIPLPASVLLFGAALGLLAGVRRRG